MNDQPQKLTADERFFVAMWELLRANGASPLSPELDPVNVWRRMKVASPSEARNGLRQAVGDLLEMTQDVGGTQLAAIDSFLTKRGAPTLTATRLERKRWLGRLLKRGSLESDEEFQALMAKLNDVEDRTLTESQRAQANEMVFQYQANRRT